MTRFGNFIQTPKKNSGFDVLRATLQKNADGRYEARIHTVLPSLGRPIDLHLAGPGKVFIAEYSRATNSTESFAPSGRIIELSVDRK
jgi:hypothetical protein